MAKKKLTRRNFIGTAAVGIAGAAVSIGSSNALAATPVADTGITKSSTGMKYRRLGRTNLMISEMILGCASGLRSQQLGHIQRFRMYYKNYGHTLDAREYYAALDPARTASACDACGICEAACPSGVAIINCLQDAHKLLA